MRQGEILLAEGRLETGWWGPGPQAAPTLVLLHEGLGCVGLWREFPSRLAEATGCGVFAYSRFGYGASSPVSLPRPLDYMHREAREVLPKVLDAIGLERGILVGHSDGGSIAAIHAASFRDARLGGLVLLAPHFFVEDIGLAAIAATRERYAQGDLRPRLARHHHDPDIAFHGWNGAWLDPAFPQAFDLSAEIERIALPTLAIQGELDPYGTDAQLRALKQGASGPVELHLLPGLGHAPQIEAPEMVLTAIRDFAGRVFGPSSAGAAA